MNRKPVKPKRNKAKSKVVREQPRKDSSSKRINLDNEREAKFVKNVEKEFLNPDSNDISWYTHNPAMIQAAARIPFGQISGLSNAATTGYQTFPTVMKLEYNPNFLPNRNVCQQAFISMYSDIVHANSRNQSYDDVDLALMVFAGAQVFAAIGHGIRAYGVMRSYIEQQSNLPKYLLAAMGFSPQDLRANYSHMWSDLLQLIAQSRQIWIPNTLDLVSRWLWMNTKIYTDGDSNKSQFYLYVQRNFYKYAGYSTPGGGKLTTVKYENSANGAAWTKHTWKEYINMVQELIDAMLPDQDRGIMYGDILKAYGAEKIFALRDIDLNYTTEISYSKEVLWQIEHYTAHNVYPLELRHDGTTDRFLEQYWTGGNGLDPTSAADTIVASTKPLHVGMLNFRQSESPTPEQITVATRMMHLGANYVPRYTKATPDAEPTKDGTKVVGAPKTCGTEIGTGAYVFSHDPNANAAEYVAMGKIPTQTSSVVQSSDLFKREPFDWQPILYIVENGTAAYPWEVNIKYPIVEADNWTYINVQDLEGIHNATLFSLLNVPVLKG